AIALGAVLLVAATINHYGLTYDEGWYLSRSQRARDWGARLLAEPGRALSDEGLRRYWAAESQANGRVLQEQQPGAVKLVCGWLGHPLGRALGVVFPERAGTALFLGGCLAALYVFVGGVWGRAAGAFAVGALLLMPRVFAHAHLCALDVPVMSMMLVTVALMFAAVRRNSLPLAALSGLAWGVALGCKINALFVPFILGAWVLLFHRGFAVRAAVCLTLGGGFGFLGTWPWLWHHTGSRLAEYLAFHLQHYPVAVSYFGRVSAHQPWHYPPVMTAITTPPVTLALALGGIGLAGWVLRHRNGGSTEAAARDAATWRRSQAALLLLGALFTIGFNCLPSAPKYTGVRLFLPFFAFLAALSAVGFAGLAAWVAQRLPAGGSTLLSPRRVKVLLAGLALLPALRVVVGSHPYQLSYYNTVIGGTRGAVARGMEATYWGDAYMAVCYDLAPRLTPGDTLWVDLPGCQWIIEQYLKPVCPDLRFTSSGWPSPEASWAIVQNKASELSPASRALLASGPPVFASELDGVPLALLYGRESIARALEQRLPEERSSPE
ncbi:MAG: hypothetical protein FJX74_18085, partial [Armatimonadetes bacterium]|nr:hypothetical protein [Armatimonadota bacterium]